MGSRLIAWRLAALVLMLHAACFEVPIGEGMTCGPGGACPAGLACVVPPDESLGTCHDATCGADGELCYGAGQSGRCVHAECHPFGCGDGVVDSGEECDDGNQASGDGCQADCGKVEWFATAVIGGNANATAVALAHPTGVAIDPGGNVYIADTDNNRIYRVDPAGVITTVAGTGTPGFSGDGGAATAAQLQAPLGVAVDGLGNLYIADTFNLRVRRVDLAGVITTVAGTGRTGVSGDGLAAINADLWYPSHIAVDGLGNFYISVLGYFDLGDPTLHHRIRRVDAVGIITTVAGTGTQGFSGDVETCTMFSPPDCGEATSAQLDRPSGVAVDGLGNVYIADTKNCRIRRVDLAGHITTVAGRETCGYSGDGGVATSAELNYPSGTAVDGLGNLYIADTVNHRIRRVDAAAGVITTIVGTGEVGFAGDGGAATSAQIGAPQDVAVDGLGRLYIADSNNQRIRRVDAVGIITTVAGAGAKVFSVGAATNAQLNSPQGVAVDGLGNVYIADTNNNCIQRVDATGVITTVAGTGTPGFFGEGVAATNAQLNSPQGVAVDGLGNLYIADTSNHRIRRVDATGVITTVAGTGTPGFFGEGVAATNAQLNSPQGVAVDGLGNLYMADTSNHRIRRVDVSGVITTVAGTGTPGFFGEGFAATNAQLKNPRGIAVDGLGNLYIADTSNFRIRRVDVGGIITTVAGTGTSGDLGDDGEATSAQLRLPQGVAVDGLGNLYLADTSNLRIRRVDVGGIITTVAGTGTVGDLGDGGAATSAQLRLPQGVGVDGLGNLYIADTNNQRIRWVDLAGVITTVAGAIDPEGVGPLGQARLADPRALVVSPPRVLFAGGSLGVAEQALTDTAWLSVVAGRYPQTNSTRDLARFRDVSFGDVQGIAYDAVAGLLYLTESSRHRIDVVTLRSSRHPDRRTIEPLANAAGTEGFADGPATSAQFRTPTGLYLDATAHELYVADTGNHVVRVIDLSTSTVRTIAGVPATRGYFGDGGPAIAALLYAPQAVTRCANGDLFIADTGNHRVRRIAAGSDTITTVLGVGFAGSSGEGQPANTFPVQAPLGLACDPIGNLLVTSTTSVRLLRADAYGVVDGTGPVQTIYGALPATFPASATRCLTGLAMVDANTAWITDSCSGLLVALHREPR